MKIGYHASHEQFLPGELLQFSITAEAAGFNGGLSSDHFHPWTPHQGQSGSAWSWLGAALASTSMSFGVVCAPGQRYHPAIIAQASATLAQMFPDRFWIAVGSGQLLNEGIASDRWPTKPERLQRLKECVRVIRDLWNGQTVSFQGMVQVNEAKLYTRPDTPPLLIGAAISPETAEWVGGWADGLITISRPREKLKKVVEAFYRGGGEGKPMFLKAQISYAHTAEEALQGAWDQWRAVIGDSSVQADLRDPETFEAAAEFVTPPDMCNHVRISIDLDKHVEWIQEDLAMGFQEIYLHNVNRGQERFIEDFGQWVLPVVLGQRKSQEQAIGHTG